ncbi:pilus assembly protein TadE [Streptomyces sp. AJS327]|nr:pilus assembly protein TadE [Streptomyces sp. AJS327]
MRSSSERGSATTELVILIPLLILVALITVALGRLVDARLVVSDAAHQAARAASIARSEEAARSAARQAVAAALRDAGAACARTQIVVDTDGLTPGGAIRTGVECTTTLGDLTRTGFPGQVTLTEHALSPIDAFRSSP